MHSKNRWIILVFSAGLLLTLISGASAVQTSTALPVWQAALMIFLVSLLAVPLFVFFLRVLPDFVILKDVFTAKYFYYVSIFIMGGGSGLIIRQAIANEFSLYDTFFLLWGISLFISSLIANRLFGGLE